MESAKKVLFLGLILLVAVMDGLLYWNQHLYFRAGVKGTAEDKIEVLEKASSLNPFNHRVAYELGKAYLELGMNSFGEEGRNNIHIQKALRNLERSLRLNPASYFAHFYLGQALLNMSFSTPGTEAEAYAEFKKAARLGGENTEIFHEVGRVFLARWPELGEEDRAFTIDILKKVIDPARSQRLRELLFLWEMNVGDYEVLEALLPEDSRVYRMVAEFLGQRSLSLNVRHSYLARAEALEFEQAKEALEAGERELYYYRMKQAAQHFRSCLRMLERIRFYESFVPEKRIDPEAYHTLKKKAFLDLSRALIGQGMGLDEVREPLETYIRLEDSDAALSELEEDLKPRGWDGRNLDESTGDLERLGFKLELAFAVGRYRDIMRVGRNLTRSFVVVPEEMTAAFVRVLEVVGEAFQKVDYIYDSNDYYLRALELDPENLDVMVKLRKNYERLRDSGKLREINRRIERVVAPKVMRIRNPRIPRERTFTQALTMDGRRVTLRLRFGKGRGGKAPLVSVFFNGIVVWEDYVEGGDVRMPVETRVGANTLQVRPVNRDIVLEVITYE